MGVEWGRGHCPNGNLNLLMPSPASELLGRLLLVRQTLKRKKERKKDA